MKPNETSAAASEMVKVTALDRIPLLAIEPPPFFFLAFGDVLRDFSSDGIEKHDREIPDDMDKSGKGHGLSFLQSVWFQLTKSDIGREAGNPVDHFSAMIAHFSKMKIRRFLRLEFQAIELIELPHHLAGRRF